MAASAIRIEDLTKEFTVGLRGVMVRAVDGLDLEVNENEVFGLLGPNGSGKSTTLKILLGLLKPTRGAASVFGLPSGRVESRREVGYLPESPYFYRFLTGRELVMFFGKLAGMRGGELRDRVEAVIEWVGLADALDRRIDTYSKGMLQRIGLAQALVHDPRLVILDEPTAGVDPLGAEAIANIIRRLKAEGKTVLLCSHQLSEVEMLCDGVAVLFQGRCLIQGQLDRLLEQPERFAVELSGLDAERLEALERWVCDAGGKIEGRRAVRVSLEQLFLETARKEEG